jgi:hypothetical protein
MSSDKLMTQGLALLSTGESAAIVAKALNVKPSTVRSWKKRQLEQSAAQLVVDEQRVIVRSQDGIELSRTQILITARSRFDDGVAPEQIARDLGLSIDTILSWKPALPLTEPVVKPATREELRASVKVAENAFNIATTKLDQAELRVQKVNLVGTGDEVKQAVDEFNRIHSEFRAARKDYDELKMALRWS